MKLSTDWKDYEVLDTSDGERLERWGKYILVRPDPQAIWPKQKPELWGKADAYYHRSVKGGGAFLNGKPMKVSERNMSHSIVAFGTCPYYKDTLGKKTFELCYELYRACSDVRRPGAAALDLAYLAAGRNDIFFEIVLSPWDIAAGNLLIKEAGGIITNAEGKDIDFSAPSCVLASNPTVYDEFYKIAKKVLTK